MVTISKWISNLREANKSWIKTSVHKWSHFRQKKTFTDLFPVENFHLKLDSTSPGTFTRGNEENLHVYPEEKFWELIPACRLFLGKRQKNLVNKTLGWVLHCETILWKNYVIFSKADLKFELKQRYIFFEQYVVLCCGFTY